MLARTNVDVFVYFQKLSAPALVPNVVCSDGNHEPAIQADALQALDEESRKLFVLEKVYGYTSFRDGQLESIDAILQGKDTLVLLPTGGGKSVIYTVPAILKQGLTVIVEPLKFIMEEQAMKLRQKQIPAFFYNSSLTNTEMEYVINFFCQQDVPYALLFTSPECIVSTRLQTVLKRWNDNGKLNFIAIDEAHCVDVWGQAFRPDYLKLGILKDFNVPVVALTGTGTKTVKDKIITTLKMDTPLIVARPGARRNLSISIVDKKEKSKQQVAKYINDTCPGQRGIVYCLKQKETVDLAHELKKANVNAVFVHGGLSDIERKQNASAWQNGLVQVICATKSFGMGVDVKDVRFVLHLSFSESLEDYFQEIGRAGRDGASALCTLLFRHEDRAFHLHNIMKIEDEDIKKHKYAMLNKMVKYCDTYTCRHKFISEYFGEDSPACEEHCDACTSNTSHAPRDYSMLSKVIIQGLSVVQHVHNKVTTLLLCQFLMGSSTTEIKALGLDKLFEFGSAKVHYSQRNGRKELKRLIYHLVCLGVIKEVPYGTADRPGITIAIGSTTDLERDLHFS